MLDLDWYILRNVFLKGSLDVSDFLKSFYVEPLLKQSWALCTVDLLRVPPEIQFEELLKNQMNFYLTRVYLKPSWYTLKNSLRS